MDGDANFFTGRGGAGQGQKSVGGCSKGNLNLHKVKLIYSTFIILIVVTISIMEELFHKVTNFREQSLMLAKKEEGTFTFYFLLHNSLIDSTN